MGAAIGFITSEPMPLAQRIGMRLARTAQTVITFGRSRYLFSTQLLNRRSAPCQLAVNAVGPVRPDWRRLSQFGGCPKDVAMMRGKQSCEFPVASQSRSPPQNREDGAPPSIFRATPRR